MSKTEIIIFSKNRTFQLKSLLMSIKDFSDIHEDEIDVIYKETPEISYKPLIDQFDCCFILQKDFFNDLSQIIMKSRSDYLFFMVDDLIFRDEFKLREVEELLDNNREIDCFSLRLGQNIEDGRKPVFLIKDGKFLVWQTSYGLGYTWRYFWEVSASIYRKDMVLKYLRKCNGAKINYPNPLEGYYYNCMPSYIVTGGLMRKIINSILFLAERKSNIMACFEISKCFAQGLNFVAERNVGRKIRFEPLELHKKMLEGYIIDYKSLKDVKNTRPNIGAEYFTIIKEGLNLILPCVNSATSYIDKT